MAVIRQCLLCRPLYQIFPFCKHLLSASITISPRSFSRAWACSLRLSTRASTSPAHVEQKGAETDGSSKVRVLTQKLEVLGINCDDFVMPGRYHRLFCPKCKGGQSMVRSLSLHIIQDGGFAMWRCFHTECGWAGQAFAESRASYYGVAKKVESFGRVSEESMGLEPLGAKLIAYFGERMISEKTLRRNAVMQMSSDKNVIAFTYRQNGLLVGCKYRTVGKRFWQEKGTEKRLYGLDDINDVPEIIIVEGEIDKLSLEEAGFCNCVSVPGGAPGKVSNKELPSFEKDTAYQYLWNCKEYLDKVSRIILATDGDTSGQALAKELARRLGKDRCWQVRWPKKDDHSCFKDANEVLKFMGPDALKKVIEDAMLYEP
ncbi:primase homolog protein isoform X2 [Juglans microcarpa x Juglans regia]|uniref:primase homolog protein isoform X2 n=1 Tax=Juglans microcarpa x Juglans regia TaxID=2249226 RepID=UPI001B7E98B8|nr:primase homolog protein isoform X2 [Juglans microcarpa x Juglans regia]